MARTGRPPKPTEVKRRTGNPGKRKLDTEPKVAGRRLTAVPDPHPEPPAPAPAKRTRTRRPAGQASSDAPSHAPSDGPSTPLLTATAEEHRTLEEAWWAELLEQWPADTPRPPRRLGLAGVAMWLRVWSVADIWIREDTDIELLQMVCEQIDDRAQLRRLATQLPIDVFLRELRNLERAITSGLSLLGFSPTDRARLGVGEKENEDALSRYRREQAERKAAAERAAGS